MCTPQPPGTAPRCIGTAELCGSPLSKACASEPPAQLGVRLPSHSAPPVSPEQELSPRGGPILLLLLAPCNYDLPPPHSRLGTQSSRRAPCYAPASSQPLGCVGLNPAPHTGLNSARHPHPSPKPNNTSWTPLGGAYRQINNITAVLPQASRAACVCI